MLSLLRFLFRHSYVVYFLLLEAVAFLFLIQNNPYQRASFLNSSDFIFASTYKAFDNAANYMNLHRVNMELANENSELRNKSIHYFRKTFNNNVIYRDSSYEQEYAFHPAKIIRSTTNQRNNYLTLDKGEMNGVRAGMGVISANGVLGIVIETSKHFSVAMSVLNKNSRLSAMVRKNGYFGSVEWPGENYRIGLLKEIPNHVSLVEGDTVVTSGFSGIFPEGVPIGTVKAVSRKPGSGFLEVEILFTQDYRKVSYANVIKYLHHLERQKLESIILDND
ncbi:MAG: rod shape-determining protein MreC [Vicingaceae bacterium]